MDDKSFLTQFEPLWSDLQDSESFPHKRPLLAHYTSIVGLENIFFSNQLWFSNPLAMNDLEEVRFAINEGCRLIAQSEEIRRALETEERHQTFQQGVLHCYNTFGEQHVLDTYVFCLSEHAKDDYDGLLSMWRGYGGNGTGAAVVFDTSQLDVIQNSALMLDRVHYATTTQRLEWITKKIAQFVSVLATASVPDDKLHFAAHVLFERLKLFALFTKHQGFSEEREWRVVYSTERDAQKRMAHMCDYAVGPRGVELKLKFPVAPVEGVTGRELSLAKMIDRIILGPTMSNTLAIAAFNRMLERLKQPHLKAKVRVSAIPFRP